MQDTVNNTPDAAKMFKATKLLTKHRKRDVFIIKDDGTRITGIENVKREMSEFCKNKFFDKNEANVPMDANGPLREPITVSEVPNAINKLSNGKAPRINNLHVEIVKCRPLSLLKRIRDILTGMFENGNDPGVGKGILVPIQKPGKKVGLLKSLRPLTLLPLIRKI